MEFLFEFLFEFIIELFTDLSTESSIPKPIRIILGVISLMLYIAILGVMFYGGVICLRKTILGGVILIAIATGLLIGITVIVVKGIKNRKTE